MKTMILLSTSLAYSLTLGAPPAHSATTKIDTAKIEQITGLKGKLNEKENVFKLSYPRTDLKVSAKGVKLTPALGLTAWAAFTPVGDHLMVMGDIVLTEDQVNSVMSVALDSGLEVTALHNHFFSDTPKVMFMHIDGMGNEEQLANAVKNIFSALKTPTPTTAAFPTTAIDPAKTTLSPAKIDAILSHPGQLKDGVYKLTFGRTAQMNGHTIGAEMGVNTWAAFAGSDDKAVVDGDFAMKETELQSILKALRKSGINIVAIHNHMTQEQPRIIFLHYWGVGTTTQLAQGLKAALDAQASAEAPH